MSLKRVCNQLNFIKLCRNSNLPLWQCPSFLFPLLGLIIIFAMIATYFIGLNYVNPEIVALIVLMVSAILLINGYLVIQGFENLAHANQMKSEFVGIVSHQLRTPLTGIKWTLELIKKGKNSDRNHFVEQLKDIENNNNRMIDLINDLLNVSRIDQGKLVINNEELPIDDILKSVKENFQVFAAAKNISLEIDVEPNLPSVTADRQALTMIISNLTDNALKYTQKEGKIKILVRRRDGTIRCEIQDEGVGIPEDEQRKIFQKFFRSKNILKYQTDGTGLGLFIAKSFIEVLHGKIGFWSKEGEGSTFWIELPINKK